MTVEEFRSNPVLVGAMRDLIKGDGTNPTVLAQAIVAVQNEKPSRDAKDNEPEIVSVRRLSRIAQHDEVINLLLSCGEPLPTEEEEERPLFGVNPQDYVVGE
jgi:hypothetical protein